MVLLQSFKKEKYSASSCTYSQGSEKKLISCCNTFKYLLHSHRAPSLDPGRYEAGRLQTASAGRHTGRAAGYEDVHGDADVKAVAAESDDGGSGTGGEWRGWVPVR